jgi:hypothetical protein
MALLGGKGRFFALRTSIGINNLISVSDRRQLGISDTNISSEEHFMEDVWHDIMFYVQKVTDFVIFCTQNIINAKNVKLGLFLFKQSVIMLYLPEIKSIA